jgi:hypothetical protein
VPIPSPIYAVVAPRALAWNHRAPPQGRRARRRRARCSLISMGEERCRPHLRPRLLLARFSCRPELGPSSKTARLSSSSAAGRNRALGQRMERFRPAVPGPCSAAATRSESSHPAPAPPAAPHHKSSRPGRIELARRGGGVRIEHARRGRLLHRGGGAGAGEEPRGTIGITMARYNPNVLPVESKRAVTFYPSGGSQEPYLHPHPIPSIHFISFLFFSFLFFSSFSCARAERDVKQWWSQEQRSPGSSASCCRWAVDTVAELLGMRPTAGAAARADLPASRGTSRAPKRTATRADLPGRPR